VKFNETPIPGVIHVEPDVHGDARGFFVETYHAERYRENGIPLDFVQDNHSASVRGTLRGLHAQHPRAQGKLVRAIEGCIYDVAVDTRIGSPTYGQHFGALLSAENKHQLYVPPGLAHGFCVTTDSAQVEYKCTGFYYPEDELSILWNDPDIGIAWPIDEPILSDKDRTAPRLKDVQDRLVQFDD
jgi:dTDP-4-dehydrorhamnose 3,5-epimerase